MTSVSTRPEDRGGIDQLNIGLGATPETRNQPGAEGTFASVLEQTAVVVKDRPESNTDADGEAESTDERTGMRRDGRSNVRPDRRGIHVPAADGVTQRVTAEATERQIVAAGSHSEDDHDATGKPTAKRAAGSQSPEHRSLPLSASQSGRPAATPGPNGKAIARALSMVSVPDGSAAAKSAAAKSAAVHGASEERAGSGTEGAKADAGGEPGVVLRRISSGKTPHAHHDVPLAQRIRLSERKLAPQSTRPVETRERTLYTQRLGDIVQSHARSPEARQVVKAGLFFQTSDGDRGNDQFDFKDSRFHGAPVLPTNLTSLSAAGADKAGFESRFFQSLPTIQHYMDFVKNGVKSAVEGGSHVHLDFESKALGNVELFVQEKAGGLQIMVQVGNEAVRDRLLLHRQEMLSQLRDFGYEDVTYDVSSDGKQHHDHQRSDARSTAENESDLADEPETADMFLSALHDARNSVFRRHALTGAILT